MLDPITTVIAAADLSQPEAPLKLSLEAMPYLARIVADRQVVLEEMPQAIAVTWKVVGGCLKTTVETLE